MKIARANDAPDQDSDAVERILAAAEHCFRGTGYADSSMREIAERAGVSKSLILYHFASKEHLYTELQLRVYERIARRVKDSIAEHGGTTEERALIGLDSLMAAVRERNDVAVHAMLSARALSNAAFAPHVRKMRRELKALLYRTMEEIFGAEAGRLPTTLEAAADLLWAALTGLGIESALDDSSDQPDAGYSALRTIVGLVFRPGGSET
jgi:AcrR family transcriptional regulator